MLYEVITIVDFGALYLVAAITRRLEVLPQLLVVTIVITSYSIHYTKLSDQFHPCQQLFERVSTSSRVTPAELAPIEPDAAAFFGTGNLYLQMLAHWGAYEFDRDLLADPMSGVDEALEPERYEYDGP